MTDKQSPLGREQTAESCEDDFSLPSTLTKTKNFFEINYDPSDIVDSDSDQNLDADELSDPHTNKDESCQYSLFRKPIEQLVNDVNPSSTISMEAHMHLTSMLNSQQQHSKVKFGDIGRNKTQENTNFQTNLFVNDEDDKLNNTHTEMNSFKTNGIQGAEQQNIGNYTSTTGGQSTATHDTFNSPFIKLNMNNSKPSNTSNKSSENNQRQALLKFRSHEAQIEFKSGSVQSTFNNQQNQESHLQIPGQNTLQYGGGDPRIVIDNLDQTSEGNQSYMFSNFTFSSANNNDQAAFVTKQLQFLGSSAASVNSSSVVSGDGVAGNNHASIESQQQQQAQQYFQNQQQTAQQKNPFVNDQQKQVVKNQNFIKDSFDQAFANPSFYQQHDQSQTQQQVSSTQPTQQQQVQSQDSIFSHQQFNQTRQLTLQPASQQQLQPLPTQIKTQQSLNTQQQQPGLLQFNITQHSKASPQNTTNLTNPTYQQSPIQQSLAVLRTSTTIVPIIVVVVTICVLIKYTNVKHYGGKQLNVVTITPIIIIITPYNSLFDVDSNDVQLIITAIFNCLKLNVIKLESLLELTQHLAAPTVTLEFLTIINFYVIPIELIESTKISQYPQEMAVQQQQTPTINQGPSIFLRRDHSHSPSQFINTQSQSPMNQNALQNQNVFSAQQQQQQQPQFRQASQNVQQQQPLPQVQQQQYPSTSPKNFVQNQQNPPQQQQFQQQQSTPHTQMRDLQQQFNQQILQDQQRFLEFNPIINLNHQDSTNSNASSNIGGYKTPVFSSSTQVVNQFEDQQQKQLISGFESIELNNQHQHKQNQNTQNVTQQLQQQPMIQIQQKPQDQSMNFVGHVDQSQNKNTAELSTNAPPGFEKVIPNPQRNIVTQQQSQELQNPNPSAAQNHITQQQQQNIQSNSQIQGIAQSNFQTSTSILNPLLSTTSIPTQYAPQLVNPFAGKQLGAGMGTQPLTTNQSQISMPFPSAQQPVISNNVLIDQNESILVKIMCNYEEATSQVQKLNSLKGNVIKLSINQTGSKFLQRLLDNANPQIVQFLLDEIQSHLPMVMVDNYGNYFCQELLINCSSAQRMQILERISVDFVAICCNKKGTHTIQKFIDLVNLEAEEKFFQRVLAGHVALLSSDVQGTHVIQNIIKCFEESKRQFVFDEIYEQFIELATDYSGLSVIKTIISKTHKPENRKRLMGKLVANAIELAQNPYGNYAIQQSFEHWDKELCQDIIPQFFGKVYQLSLQKCSSNVIDKCIQNSKPEYLAIIMQELINCERLNNLITNSYGNFVVQNALKFATQEEKKKLSEQIEKNIPNISDSKIKQKWVTLLKKKALGETKGMFKSQDSDTSETSSKSGMRGGPKSDYSGRSEHGKNNKKSVGGGNFGNLSVQSGVPNFNQGALMPPPSNRPGAHGMGYYNNNQGAFQQNSLMHSHTYPNQQHSGQTVQGVQGYYNPQMQMYAQTQQNQQMNMGKPAQNNQIIGSHAGFMMGHPQGGYMMQQQPTQSQMAPNAFQQNMYLQNSQQQVQMGQLQPTTHYQQPQFQPTVQQQQYDPLGLPDQSILGKRPLSSQQQQMHITSPAQQHHLYTQQQQTNSQINQSMAQYQQNAGMMPFQQNQLNAQGINNNSNQQQQQMNQQYNQGDVHQDYRRFGQSPHSQQ
eukprot:403332189